MTDQFRRRYPTMSFSLANRRVWPGGTVAGKLHLHGGTEPVALESVWARLWARVYSDFDDDLGARTVDYLSRTIAPEIRLGVEEERAVEFRLPVALTAPVTLLHGVGLRGVTLALSMWGRATAPAGDATVRLQVEPLPWQERVLNACGRIGLRLGGTYAFARAQHFHLERDDPRKAAGVSSLCLSWTVYRRRGITVALHGHRRRGCDLLELTHEQAMRERWEERLSDWLSASGQGPGP